MSTPKLVPEPLPDINSPAAKEAARFLSDVFYDPTLSSALDKALANTDDTARIAAITQMLASHKYACKAQDIIAGYSHFQNTSFLPWTGHYILYDAVDPKKSALSVTIQGSKTGSVSLLINGSPIYDVIDTSQYMPRSLFFNGAKNGMNGLVVFGISTKDDPVLELGSRYVALRLFAIGDKCPKTPTHVGVEFAHDFSQFHGSYLTTTTDADGESTSAPAMRVEVHEYPEVGKQVFADLLVDSGNKNFVRYLQGVATSRNTLSWTSDKVAIDLKDPKYAHLAQFANGYMDFSTDFSAKTGHPDDPILPTYILSTHLVGSVWALNADPKTAIVIEGDYILPTVKTDEEVLAANKAVASALTHVADVVKSAIQPEKETHHHHHHTQHYHQQQHTEEQPPEATETHVATAGVNRLLHTPLMRPGGPGGDPPVGGDPFGFIELLTPAATYLGDTFTQWGSFASGHLVGAFKVPLKAILDIGSFSLFKATTSAGGSVSLLEFGGAKLGVGGAAVVDTALNAQGGPLGGSASGGSLLIQSMYSYVNGMGTTGKVTLAAAVLIVGGASITMWAKGMKLGDLARYISGRTLPNRAIEQGQADAQPGARPGAIGDPSSARLGVDHLNPWPAEGLDVRVSGGGNFEATVRFAQTRIRVGKGSFAKSSSGKFEVNIVVDPRTLDPFLGQWKPARNKTGEIMVNPLQDKATRKLFSNDAFGDAVFALRLVEGTTDAETRMVPEVRQKEDGQLISMTSQGVKVLDSFTNRAQFEGLNMKFIFVENAFKPILIDEHFDFVTVPRDMEIFLGAE